MALIIWFFDTVIILIIISVVAFVLQSIIGGYRMRRFLQAEIQAGKAQDEAEIKAQEEERLRAEAFAKRKRITDEQQKSYERRNRRANGIRQVKAYYLRRPEELSDDRLLGNGGTSEADRLVEIEDIGQHLKRIRTAEKEIDDARQGLEETGKGV